MVRDVVSMKYSNERREAILKKLLPPRNRTVARKKAPFWQHYITGGGWHDKQVASFFVYTIGLGQADEIVTDQNK